jgi:hypothetical protein
MKRTGPPFLAAWMLEHWTPGGCDHALAGDLQESFRAGRSNEWYWRQVLAALAIQWTKSLFRHRIVLIFAAAWAALSPAWSLLIIRLHHSIDFTGPIWRQPWPWSTVLIIGLSTAESLLFIWTGVLVYLVIVLTLFQTTNHWRIGRAFAASVAGYVLAVACELAIAAMVAAPSSTAHGTDWGTLTLTGVIADFSVWAILRRLPCLIGILCALWEVASIDEHPITLVE